MIALGLDESSDESPRYSWPCGGLLKGDDNVQTALRLLRQHLGIQARRGDLQFVGIEDRWTDELDSKAVGIASYVLSLCDKMPEISSQSGGLLPPAERDMVVGGPIPIPTVEAPPILEDPLPRDVSPECPRQPKGCFEPCPLTSD